MVHKYRAKKHGVLLSLTVSVNSYIVNFLVFVDSLRRTFVICTFYEYWKQYLICSPLASKLQIAVNKDIIDIDNFSLQKLPPVAAKINRDEFLGISFSHHMEILHKTKDLHEILLDSNEIRQLRDVCIFEVNGIEVYM